jgi:TonB-dependent starch-binding outer membrane protein SusC
MLRHLWGGCIVLLIAAVTPATAQVREVNGRITNEQTGQEVSEAVISVEGTGIGTRSGTDGRFAFNIPDGDQTLSVRAIGFRRDSVVVPATSNTVTIALEPDPFKLEEVVVTGQSTGIERQNLPNAVATVSADELTRAPTGTLETALQGKIPGALIQQNSGAPGGGVQVNLRGVSTINAGAEPLFVIDGIVVSNSAATLAIRTTRPIVSPTSTPRTSSG